MELMLTRFLFHVDFKTRLLNFGEDTIELMRRPESTNRIGYYGNMKGNGGPNLGLGMLFPNIEDIVEYVTNLLVKIF